MTRVETTRNTDKIKNIVALPTVNCELYQGKYKL